MRKTSFFLITLIIMVFAFQAGALELGAGLWLPEGVFESAGNRSFEGSLKVLTVPGSPLGIGPVALVSETNLGSNLNLGDLKTMIKDKTGKGFLYADFLVGIRMNLPIKLFGVSAQGLVSYGGTGFANVNLANEDSSYFTSLYWGPRFRAQLRKDIFGSLLRAVASYEFAPELQGLRKKAELGGELPDEVISATLTNYRLGLEAHIPFATVGAGYRALELKDTVGGYKADFSGFYAEARVGF